MKMNGINMQAFMERAKAVAEARKNRPAESFWPNVKTWLSTHEGKQPLPTCPVCYKELDINGIEPVPRLDDEKTQTENNTTHEPCEQQCDSQGMGSVLTCGHMMCHNCIMQSLHEFSELFPCPVCRKERHNYDLLASCEHQLHYHVPTSTTKILDHNMMVPLTVPEGGKPPTLCLACMTGTQPAKEAASHCCYYQKTSEAVQKQRQGQPFYSFAVTYDLWARRYNAVFRLNDVTLRSESFSGSTWSPVSYRRVVEYVRFHLRDDMEQGRICRAHFVYVMDNFLQLAQQVPERIREQWRDSENNLKYIIFLHRSDQLEFLAASWPENEEEDIEEDLIDLYIEQLASSIR